MSSLPSSQNFKKKRPTKRPKNDLLQRRLVNSLFGCSPARVYTKLPTKLGGKWFDWLEEDERTAWPKKESGEFVAALLSRMMKIGMLSLVAVMAFPLIQTFILTRQNDLFERQNSFIAFEQTTKFQELLSQLPLDSLNNKIENYQAFPDSVVPVAGTESVSG